MLRFRMFAAVAVAIGLFAAAQLRADPVEGFDEDLNPASTDDVQLKYVQLTLRYLW